MLSVPAYPACPFGVPRDDGAADDGTAIESGIRRGGATQGDRSVTTRARRGCRPVAATSSLFTHSHLLLQPGPNRHTWPPSVGCGFSRPRRTTDGKC